MEITLFLRKRHCSKLQHDSDKHGGRHADERHPRPAEDAAEDRGHAKCRDALDKHEAPHAANHGGNHLPTLKALHEEGEQEHAEQRAREEAGKEERILEEAPLLRRGKQVRPTRLSRSWHA